MFDDLDLPIECPKCGSRLPATLGDVAQSRTVRCPRGHEVDLEDEGDGARKAVDASRKLDKALKDLGRTIKFKL